MVVPLEPTTYAAFADVYAPLGAAVGAAAAGPDAAERAAAANALRILADAFDTQHHALAGPPRHLTCRQGWMSARRVEYQVVAAA